MNPQTTPKTTYDYKHRNHKRIKTSIATIEEIEPGILILTYDHGAHETLKEAREILSSMVSMRKGKPWLVIIDLEHTQSISREARTFYASEAAQNGVIAAAFVADNFFARLIGNIFMQFNCPGHPARLFSSKTNALAWLKQYHE